MRAASSRRETPSKRSSRNPVRRASLPKVSVTDSFFDLGGHSMLAAQMMAAVESTFGKNPAGRPVREPDHREPLPVLRQSTPPCRRAGRWSSPSSRRVTKTPLFCVSRFNVSALGYIALARNLGPDQPVYGLQLQYRAGGHAPYQRFEFETAAKQYLAAMKEVQPHGPYNLIGMCEGALDQLRDGAHAARRRGAGRISWACSTPGPSRTPAGII